jgi:thiol-disulfide isomerase/thioredoxin
MKGIIFSLALFGPDFLFAQEKFTIELEAPSHINETLIFAPYVIKMGFEKIYNFRIDTSDNIKNFGGKFGITSAFYLVKVQQKNIIDGQCDYPQPVSLQYYDPKAKRVFQTSTFFLQSGNYKIALPEMFDSYEVNFNTPLNKEYVNFKKLFSDLYKKLDNGYDSLIDLSKKQQRIGSYIKQHPNSYVALWEIINDYTLHRFNSIYLDNLQLFSGKIKKTELYKKLESALMVENSTMSGKEFPDINFDKENKLTKEDFKKYKLTFIDYWSTTCLPCMKAMPDLVALYNDYKDKGVNFITITDENEPKRIALANNILQKNHVNWTNYFDIGKDFKNKVNANVYPLQFLIDQNGVIVTRVTGNLNEIRRIIDERLK